MKTLLSTLALCLLLSSAFAQQAEPVPANPPAPGTQAAAQAAAQQSADQPSAAEPQPPADQQPASPQTADPQQPAPQPPYAAPPAPQEVQPTAEYPPPSQEQQYPADPNNPPSDSGRRVLRPRRLPQDAPQGLTPRAAPAAYPVYREQPELSIGARLLSPREVEQKFATPLGKHYLVVEVGVFPSAAQPLRLRPDSFTIRPGNEDQAFFALSPGEIAEELGASGGGRNLGVYPRVGVGYERGPWGSGTSTGIGVGVGSRPYPRGPVGANRRVILQELRDKSLPQGSITQPVAGYVFFPLKEKRNIRYTLELHQGTALIPLALPAPNN